ncbi:MAG TPA: methyltransferase, partial [Desulfopila sp.]|nr:methyltransferase [Desulfopila sp.]
AWLSHILHSNDEETCRRIIEKTARLIQPGGRILIHDFILDNTRTAPEFAALFSLNMLVNNGVGRSYTDEEICNMMESSGLSDLQRLSIDSANDSSILMGIV